MVKSQNNLFTFVEPAAAAAGFGGCWRALDLDDASDAQDRADPSDFKRCRESFMDSGQAASDGKQLILSSPTNTRVRVFPLPPRNGGCPQLDQGRSAETMLTASRGASALATTA
mmetsp:Transcript_28176/g.64131  ORF Transcript_28176/g.64131 Transcript_28176/m.64131 type:complete len:114 (+) Transcript_28176:699-1040(+)